MTAIPSIGGSVGLAFALALSTPLSAAYQGDQGDLLPPDVKIDWFGPKPDKETKVAPKAPVRKAGSPEILERMLGNRRVTFLKVDRYFLPSNKGKAAAIQSSDGGWLAFVGNRFQAWFPEIADSQRGKARARMYDLTEDSPKAFLMPGLCDADSRFFRNPKDLADSGQNLATPAAATMALWEKGWEDLPLDSGVTTLFVPAGTLAMSSGHGALIGLGNRPLVLQAKGGLSYRISNLSTRGTNLSRDQYVRALDKAFEGAEKYKEAKEKHEKALEEYKKKRKEFLAYYKKNPMKKGDKSAAPAATTNSSGNTRRRVGLTAAEIAEINKLPRSERRKAMQELMRKKASAGQAKPTTPPAKDSKDSTAKGGKAPARPKYPKPFKESPQNEALLEVLDGKSFLRIEAHRAGEIRALLDLKKTHALDKLVILGATEAWKVADEIAKAGALVVLRPENLPTRGYDILPEHLPSQAARLSRAEVPVCFGSAGKREAGSLPLLAARAVAHGMSETQALESLTKTAWLASGGEGDSLVVFSGDPLAAGSRVLCVLDRTGLRRPGGK